MMQINMTANRKKKKQGRISKLEQKLAAIFACFAVWLMCSPIYAYGADKLEQAAKSAGTGIEASGKGMLRWLVVGVLVIGGIILIVGGERGKETVKGKALPVIGGIALVLMASGLAVTFLRWFQ